MKTTNEIQEINLFDIPDNERTINFRNCFKITDNFNLTEYISPDFAMSSPMRTDFTILLFCKKGNLAFRLNLREFQMKTHDILIAPANSIGELTSLESGCELFMIAFSTEFYNSFDPVTYTEMLTYEKLLRKQPFVHLEDKAFATIYSYYELMREKLCDDTFPLKEKFLPICLRLLSFELFHQVTKNIEAQEREEKPSRQEQIFNMFLECLNNNYKKERSLTFYANQLCLSPKHMSRCIVSFSGRPATEWIRNYVILEAKVLLRTRKYTIQQICYMLNFPNASFFRKYFKEAVGISPKQYQQNHI